MRPAVGFLVYVAIFFPVALAKLGWQRIRRFVMSATSKFSLKEMETRPWGIRGMRVVGNRWPLRYRLLLVAACLLLGILLLSVFGCTGPTNMAEMLSVSNTDPEEGILILEGAPSSITGIYDDAGRLVGIIPEKGVSPALTFKGRTVVRLYTSSRFNLRLPRGNYYTVTQSRYWRTIFFPPARVKRGLLDQSASFSVTGNPRSCYESEYTMLYWAWCLRINTGTIPQYEPGAIGFPKVDISGTGIIGDALRGLGLGR